MKSLDQRKDTFYTLLKRNENVRKTFEKSFLDLKYILLQHYKYEFELMSSYCFQDNKNPTYLVSKILNSLKHDEKQLIVTTLEDKNKDRRLYSESTSQLFSKKGRNFSSTWATPVFRNAWHKCIRPSNTRHLRQFVKNNKTFVELTGIDRRIFIDFLDDKFFFETNLTRWVYQGQEIA